MPTFRLPASSVRVMESPSNWSGPELSLFEPGRATRPALGLGLPLWMDRLAAGEHGHELLDPALTRLSTLGGGHPVEDGIAIGAAQAFEPRFRRRGRLQRGGKVRRNLHGRLACVRTVPTAVCLGLLHWNETSSTHPTLFDEPSGDCHIPFRPRATRPSRSEPSPESALVTLRELPVHSAVTDRFFEGLLIGQGRRIGGSLLRQDQPDTLGLSALISEPL